MSDDKHIVQFKPKRRHELEKLMHEKGFDTMTQFAQALGIDLSRVSRIMSGHEVPSTEVGLRICNELGIEVRELQRLCGVLV